MALPTPGSTAPNWGAQLNAEILARQYAPERPVVGAVTDLVVPGIALRDLAVGVSVGANLILYMPAFVTEEKTLLSLNVEVTTAVAASNIRLGVYRVSTSFQPAALVVDSGLMASTSTGKKTFTTSTALTPGTYLAAIASDAAVQVRGWQGVGIPNQPLNGSTFGGGGNIMRGLWSKSQAFAAYTDPGTAWDTSTDAGSSAFAPTFPLIAFGF